MTAPRDAAREHYDAHVDLLPKDGLPSMAIVFVKFTYRFDDAGVHHAPPSPLVGDIGALTTARELTPDSDFIPVKPSTDVVVLGSAYPRPGDTLAHRDVEIGVGSLRKRLRVFGRRRVRGHLSGAPRIESAEPLSVVPLTRAEAYGGQRALSPIEERRPPLLRSLVLSGREPHASYPRNPEGKGYWHPAWANETLELPRVEDPTDPLTMDRLAQQPERPWFEAPLPWHLDWMGLDQFPRFPLLLTEANLRPTPEQLAEVARGLWPADGLDVSAPSFVERGTVLRSASLGLAWPDPRTGAPVELVGMHEARASLRFALPAPPHLAFEIEGTSAVVEPRLNSLVIHPDTQTFTMTWAGVCTDLPRTFVPGLHAHIPLRVSVDGEAPLEYTAPPQVFAGAPTRGSTSAHPWSGSGATPDRSRDEVPHAESVKIGHVDPARGRVLLHEIDFQIATHVPLTIERFYSSSMSWRSGPLGPGWSHALDPRIWMQGEWILYRMADGTEVGVPLRGGALGLGAQVHHAPSGVTIRRLAAERYTVEHADGRRFDFTVLDPRADAWIAKLSTIYGADGAALEVRYDSASTLDRLVLPGGECVRFEHDAAGRLSRVTAPTNDGRERALVAAYAYNTEGELREALDGAGLVTTYSYRLGRLLKRCVGERPATHFTYQGEGAHARCTEERWAENHRTIHFDKKRRRFGVRTATDDTVAGYATEQHAVVKTQDALARVVARSFDEATGLVTSQTSVAGEITFLYDADRHLADVSATDAGSLALEHDARGHRTRRRDPDGVETGSYWDTIGRLVAIDHDGASTLYEHDEGALSAITTPLETRITIERDPSGRAVVAVRSAFGERRARLDSLGRITEVRDEMGGVHMFAYDLRGHVKEHLLPAGVRLAFTSDERARVTAVQDGARSRSLERDDEGRLMHVDEGGEGPRLHRDAEGRVNVVESEAYDYWEFSRGGAGHVTAENGFSGEARFTLRDHAGRDQRSMRGRVRTTIERDAAARPVELEHSDGSFQRFAWSPGGRLMSAQEADRRVLLAWDRGRLQGESTGQTELTNTFGVLGVRTALDSSLGLRLRVERDVLGNAMKLSARLGGHELDVRFERDALGRERERHVPGRLSLRLDRDGLGRLTRRSVRSDGRDVSALDYSYAGLSRISRVVDSRRGARECVHDARGRLVGVGALVRALDPIGRAFRSADMDDHIYDGLRLIEAYGDRFAYDDAGRRVQRTSVLDEITRYTWDTLGRLIAVHLSDDDRVAYDYDALGRMVRRRRERRAKIDGIDEPVCPNPAEP